MVKRGRIIAFFLLVLLLFTTMGGTTEQIMKNIKLGLDLQGGFEVLYEVTGKDGEEITDEVLASTAEALDQRVNVLGVSEPRIDIEDPNRVRVQLAGVEDQATARQLLATEAELSLRDVNNELLFSGADLVEGSAQQSFDQNGQPNVVLELKNPDKLLEITTEISRRPLGENLMVIWLDWEEGDTYAEAQGKEDSKVISAPRVSQPLSQPDISIEGSFSTEEAQTLASLLNAGSLPVELEEVYSTSVGAQLGQEALDATVLAGIIGVAIIFLFMVAFYRFPGLIAVITLSTYIFVILLVFDWMNAVLTLPGIAALLLGVGMAVDANIITYERIKEELRVGRSVKAAFKEGGKNSFATIVDANLTTLLAAGVLFVYGTSSVKGFATMLILSILASFLTSVFLSRMLLSLWIHSNALNHKFSWFGVNESKRASIEEGLDTLDLNTRYDRIDFAKHAKKFFWASGVLLVIGLIFISVFRLNLGIDFTSGSRVEFSTDTTLTTDEVTALVEEAGYPSTNVALTGEEQDAAVIRYPVLLEENEVNELKAAINAEYGVEPSVSTVSPTIGRELAKNAVIAVLIASAGIILYVTIRFEWKMALAAVIALLHDAFFIIALFSVLQLEVDITFIAAVLTIIGYSINDTIVTFDRIRENLRKKRKIKEPKEIDAIVNNSLRQTLNRSISTVITVVFVVVSLYGLGASTIANFSFALLIGLIAGTYSSIFIAAQLWMVWKKRELRNKGSIVTYKEKKEKTDEPVV
ncbi:protein translocase subunit SecDF [Bacillus fonticola]|uniref:protein translocase subunit SecDF n=1 Tax=Bacillus fonticola TaxID=2728853 RepID=UPI001473EA55|nr:protein translocase subunit SecDF [Bacillus fonticola]